MLLKHRVEWWEESSADCKSKKRMKRKEKWHWQRGYIPTYVHRFKPHILCCATLATEMASLPYVNFGN